MILFGLAVASASPLQERDVGLGVSVATSPLDFPVRIDGASLQWQVSPKFAIEPQFWASHVRSIAAAEAQQTRVRGELRLRGYPLSKDALHLTVGGSAAIEQGWSQAEAGTSRSTTGALVALLGAEWTPSSRVSIGLDLETMVANLQHSIVDDETLGTTIGVGPTRMTPKARIRLWF